MTTTTILNGDDNSISEDILAAHIRYARRGHRLVIFDFADDLAKRHFARGDAHIDLWLGQYDFFADHQGEGDYQSAVDEMFGYHFDRSIIDPAKALLTRLLAQQGRYGTIAALQEAVCSLSHDQVRKSLTRVPSDDGKAARLTWSVMSTLREMLGRIHDRDPHSKLTSVSAWMDLEPSSILFVSHFRSSDPMARALSGRLRTPRPGYEGGAEVVFAPDRSEDDDPYERQLELGLKSDRDCILTIDLDDDFGTVGRYRPAQVGAVDIPSLPYALLPTPGSLDRPHLPEAVDAGTVDGSTVPAGGSSRARASVGKILAWALAGVLGLLGAVTLLDDDGSAADRRRGAEWMAVSDRRLEAADEAERTHDAKWMASAERRLDDVESARGTTNGVR